MILTAQFGEYSDRNEKIKSFFELVIQSFYRYTDKKASLQNHSPGCSVTGTSIFSPRRSTVSMMVSPTL